MCHVQGTGGYTGSPLWHWQCLWKKAIKIVRKDTDIRSIPDKIFFFWAAPYRELVPKCCHWIFRLWPLPRCHRYKYGRNLWNVAQPAPHPHSREPQRVHKGGAVQRGFTSPLYKCSACALLSLSAQVSFLQWRPKVCLLIYYSGLNASHCPGGLLAVNKNLLV